MPTIQALASLAGRLWKTGNLWARWALALTAAWPPTLALVALIGSRALTSIFGLVPIAGLVFVLVAWTDPLVIPILATTHLGRTGLQWMLTIFSAELLLGVYFAVIPVHNDPGLVPLFLLTTAALASISLGARFPGRSAIQAVLVAVISILTAVFVAGGSAVVEQHLLGRP